MSIVEELSLLKVPSKSYFSCQGSLEKDLTVDDILKPASISLKAGQCYSADWESLGIAQTMLGNIAKGSDFAQWLQGNSDKSLLKEKEVFEIKDNLLSLWKSFSTSLLAQVIVRTILIADSYLEYFSLFHSPESISGNIPIWDMAVPAAKLYTAFQKVGSALQTINKATNKDIANQGYGALVSGTADVLSATTKLAAIYFLYRISPVTELIFATASYIGSIIDLIQNKQSEKTQRIDEIVRHRPDASAIIRV